MPISYMTVWPQRRPQNWAGNNPGGMPLPVDRDRSQDAIDVAVMTGDSARMMTGKPGPIVRIPGHPTGVILTQEQVQTILDLMRETVRLGG